MTRSKIINYYVAALVAIFLIVPMEIYNQAGSRGTYRKDLGYSMIFSYQPEANARINMSKVMLEALAATAVFGAAWYKIKE